MATTILRVKRPLHESPADALLIQCKKAKIEAEPVQPSLFVFSGTTEENDTTNIRNVMVKHGDKTKEKTTTDVEALRQKIKSTKYNEDYRMKIINYTRGLNVDTLAKDVDDIPKDYSLLDLQHPKYVEDSKQKYTYDLYRYQENNAAPIDIDNLEGVYSFQNELFSTYRDIGMNDPLSGDEQDADEDSNDENHCGNEYPDTDDSIDEEDMLRVVQNMNLGNDLSSDDNEEDLVNPDTLSELAGLNPDDINRYGLAYAKYKSRVLADVSDDSMPKLIEFDDSNANKTDEKDEETEFYYPINDDFDDVPSLKSGSSDSDNENSLSDAS